MRLQQLRIGLLANARTIVLSKNMRWGPGALRLFGFGFCLSAAVSVVQRLDYVLDRPRQQ